MTARAKDIRAYVVRDWDLLARTATVRHPEDSLAVADTLREQARAQVFAWPAPEERRADFESHVRVAALLERAARVRSRSVRTR